MKWQDKLRLEKEITFPGWKLVIFDSEKRLHWEEDKPGGRQSMCWPVDGMTESAIVTIALTALEVELCAMARDQFRYQGREYRR